MKKIFSIKDKVIVLTGATGHLGSKMANHLTKAGAVVIILSTKLKKAKKLCKKLKISKKQAFQIDISDEKNIKTTIKTIYEQFNKIDILVNNANFSITKKFNTYTKDDWHKSFDGTVISVDLLTQAVVPYMKKNTQSRIINISSMYGIVSPNPDIYLDDSMINPLSYGVGKAAIIQYTKYLAMSLAKYNITVNSVSFGPFPNTKIVKDKQFLKNLAKKTMLNKIGDPKETTSVIYFLSLDESSYITGQNFIVDGGWTTW